MEAPKQSDFSPSDRIFKWWIITTLAVNISISALIFLFLTVGLGKVRETRGLMDMLILFYHMVREAGGIIGAIYLFIFGSNAVLLGRILYHRCKPEQLEEKVAVRAAMSNIGIKAWIILILLIDVAAIVFPFLTMYLRHLGTEGSHAAMAGEVYYAAGMLITSDRRVHMSTRNTVCCMGQGQATGTAAALCAAKNCGTRELRYSTLRKTLVKGGVYFES